MHKRGAEAVNSRARLQCVRNVVDAMNSHLEHVSWIRHVLDAWQEVEWREGLLSQASLLVSFAQRYGCHSIPLCATVCAQAGADGRSDVTTSAVCERNEDRNSILATDCMVCASA